jgi:cellulose biosynthesis protein BcsQ
MKSVVFFNNKGGVGKTTLTCNIVSYLQQQYGLKILLIDADPQCNATQALLTDTQCENIYSLKKNNSPTLFDIISPLEAGESEIEKKVVPLPGAQNKFGVDLIPGHPKVALFEDRLSQNWGEAMKLTPAGFRVTNWCSQLYQGIGQGYDLVIFDVGPSLGALNRSVLLSCDYLVTPFGCDIFSLLGIQNISEWVIAWQKQYDRAFNNINEDRPDSLNQYPIVKNTNEKFRFAGYSVQQYLARSFKSGKRPIKAYDRIMQEIPDSVKKSMFQFKPELISDTDVNLGNIPFLNSLVPLSQSERMPIHLLKDSGKIIGSQYKQIEDYKTVLESVCLKLMNNIGVKID